MSVWSANVGLMRGLESSIAVDIRRHGAAGDKKATNWPGCLQLKNNGDKPRCGGLGGMGAN
jgi:hypothetical protein